MADRTRGGAPPLADGMEAADVGIDDGQKPASMDGDEPSPKSARLLQAHGFTRITYVHIHQSDDFSVRLRPHFATWVRPCRRSKVSELVPVLADRRVLLSGRRDAAAARPPGDGGSEQTPLRIGAGEVLRLGHRAAEL
jgi:hypothetical protein